MISNRILGGPSLILDQSVGPIMDKNRLVSNLVDTDEQYFEGPQHSSRRVDSKEYWVKSSTKEIHRLSFPVFQSNRDTRNNFSS